jgi:AhpD family alkylhydroperoxidase
MNILPATTDDPIGAAALLGHADPVELERFSSLEDAVWGQTSLTPATVESVRLHCAKIRGCEFCAAVRYKPAIDDGLSEAQVAQLGSSESRDAFSAEQSAALTLADHFLRDPRKPASERSAEIAAALGSSGVVEVLIACGAFASADLRIALGENREPNGDHVFDRAGVNHRARSDSNDWPQLDGPVLDPATTFSAVDASLSQPIRDRSEVLWSGRDIDPALVAACILRSAQLLGVKEDDPVMQFLVPERAAKLADQADVRNWPNWDDATARAVMSLAEQLWMDPAGVGEDMTRPLTDALGIEGLIRVAWNLIFIGQLHRLALVLHRKI